MANFDTSTPQLKFVKRLMDAYITCDISNVELLISKQFQHEPLPESTEFHKEAKEGHVQKWGRVLSLVKKLEVRIRHRGTAFKLRLTSKIPS